MNEPAKPHGLSAAERDALLSDLVDGQASALHAGCAAWRDDPQARATWHTYHLIGDVLRSDDLASTPRRDRDFLAGVRARLADEPTVLAPQPLVMPAQTTAAPRRAWLAPAAVAAGFMVVAGVLVVARLSAPAPEGPVLAVNPSPATGFSYARNTVTTPTAPSVIEGRLIRSPGLDSYLRAHREALGGVPAAVPGGLPRSIETLDPITPVSASVER
jgi:sigma-E factor negative regulatory protein RseA